MFRSKMNGLWMTGAVVAGLGLLAFSMHDNPAQVVDKDSTPASVGMLPPAEQQSLATVSSRSSMTLHVGQQRMAVLHTCAGTGFGWQLAEPLPAGSPIAASLSGVEHDESNCCGFPVPVTLTITAIKPGKLTLRLVYTRPWEKDKPPARVQMFDVEVTNPDS